MADQPITEPPRDLLLQFLDLCIPELDDIAGFEIDQVIMMFLRCPLVTGMAVAEFVTLNDALRFQAPDSPVDGSERDMRALRHDAAMQFEHVGMILGVREDLGDQAALIRQSHPLCPTLCLDAVGRRQRHKSRARRPRLHVSPGYCRFLRPEFHGQNALSLVPTLKPVLCL